MEVQLRNKEAFQTPGRSALEPISTNDGVIIRDIVRYFHGDGPAQQFEAGNKIGDNYPCVGCEAHASRFDDLAYSFRAHHLTLEERQQFILNGVAWKHSKLNPLKNMKVQALTELQHQGCSVNGKRKPELQEMLNDIQKGIANIPAIIQGSPQATLQSIGLGNYEVFPREPLHDLKGHFENVIDECMKNAPANVKEVVKHIHASVLKKSTPRGCDYRKAIVLIYNELQAHPVSDYTELFRTAVEISEILYSNEAERSPRAILRLHNITYVHARLCCALFRNSTTHTNMFGRYFHSITTHAPLLFRIISLRSVNAEIQERMFNQCKQITKATSNQNPNHVLKNIIVRMCNESKGKSIDYIKKEGVITKLAKSLATKFNTVIPREWLAKAPTQYQVHLERIGDYIMEGEGIWWQKVDAGIEFFDITSNTHSPKGPQIMHFRDTSLSDVDHNLLTKWEKCLSERVTLPAMSIRYYTDQPLQLVHFN